MNLQENLEELREKIKAEERASGARASAVCSDNAISEMVKVLPREESDFFAIEGLGKTFFDKYSARFLKVINEYIKAQAKVFKANNEVVNTLKELEKKLVNLNKSNKLLYISHMTPKSVLDISSILNPIDVLALLFKEKRRLKLCDLQIVDKVQYKLNEANYRKLVQLMREVNRDFREKGQYDLYIGYPFIKGKIAKEDFEFNAPAVLFPVKLDKETNFFTLALDSSRDIVYNNNVLLALNKFTGSKKLLPNNVIEEINKNSFIDDLKNFYKNNGLELEGADDTPTEFTAARNENVKRNSFTLSSHVVIGKFSTYSSSIQKDINDIIERLEINVLLKDLLQGVDDLDMYADDIIGDAKILEQNDKIQERQLNYITALNSTQENIVIAADSNKELVVQGPPGTGKSQVITSLISSAVIEGKNVLMISEKKSALDVVYSRLGNLSRFTMLIDDVNNKDNFYSQLKSMIDKSVTDIPNTADSVSTDVDKYMYALSVIADKMCDTAQFGVEIYKLYQMYPRWKLEDNAAIKLYKAVGVAAESLKKYKFDALLKIHSMYRNSALDEKLANYVEIGDRYPIIGKFKDNVSLTDIMRAADTYQRAVEDYGKAKYLSYFKRKSCERQAEKTIKSLLNSIADRITTYEVADVLTGKINLKPPMHAYESYIDAKQIYDKLLPEARDYFAALHKLAVTNDLTLINSNDLIFKYLVNEALMTFESDNRTTLHNINNYNGVLDTLSKLLAKKIDITKGKLYDIFCTSLKYLTVSKRSGDIKRVIESKRRWSVKKFTDKFSFEIFRGIKVWLLTPEVVSEIMPLVNGLFDLVIFDEASQMYIEKAIPAIMRAKSVIIAGDSKQLRPSNLGAGRIDLSDEDDEDVVDDIAALEEESLLDVARFKYPPIMLDFHYRSKYEELIAFSNYAFYGGKLNVSPNPIPPERPPIEVVDVADGRWQDRKNIAEVREIVRLLKDILTNRKNNETLGIITFNSSQRDLIMDIIDETSAVDNEFYKKVMREMERKDNGEDTGLFIKNIENVQGDERDIIIFSIGYAKNSQGKMVKQFGWLNQKGGENRLNVAISRAKSKVYIIKSISAREFDVDECRNNGPKYLKKYLAYAEAISNSDKETAKRILFSFIGDKTDKSMNGGNLPKIARQLKHELERRGYIVEENVGIGDYNIDMAIMKDGKYQLGIEFDSSLYDISHNTRERDYHRWNYFRLRGWKMYRVWSSAWWSNPGLELGRILKKLAYNQ